MWDDDLYISCCVYRHFHQVFSNTSDNQTYKMYHYVGKKLKSVYSYNKLVGEYPSRQQLVGILKTHQLRCIPGLEPTSVVVIDL